MIRALLIGLVVLAGASTVSARDCDRDFRLARAAVNTVETTVELGVCDVKHVVTGTYHVIHCVQPVRSTVEFIVETVRDDKKPVRRALKALVQKIRDRNCCDECDEDACDGDEFEPSCGGV